MNVPVPIRESLPKLALQTASTALFERKRLWVWPLIAAGLLAIIGFWVRSRVDLAVREQIRSELETLLNADVAGLKIWLQTQKANAVNAARSGDVIRLCGELMSVAESPGDAARNLSVAPAAQQLADELAPWLDEHGYRGYIIADRTQQIIASHATELLGKRDLPGYEEFLTKALAGEATVSHPFPSVIVLADEETGRMSAGMPTMYAAAPIKNDAGEVIGALGLRLQPDVDFTRILRVAQAGTSGETYAFNRAGLLLCESRFDKDLKRAGLIPDRPEAQSILQIELRNPGGDVTSGYRPAGDRAGWPLTEPVASAVAGGTGVNTAGYRDYRGVPSVAAWTWLPEYEFGVVTEMDKSEAYAPMMIVRSVFWGLFSMLAVGSPGTELEFAL